MYGLIDTERSLIAELASPEQRIIAAGAVDGRAYAEVAHEALFTTWSTLRGWIYERRAFYAWSTQIAAERKDWENEGQRSAHLLIGRPLERAKSYLEADEDDIPPDDVDFIRKSAEADRRNKTLVFRSVVGALVIAVLLAASTTWFWWQARSTRDEALRFQSKALTDFSRQATDSGDATSGILLALEALPDTTGSNSAIANRPYWWPAEAALEKARRATRELAVLRGHEGGVRSVAVSADCYQRREFDRISAG